MSQVAVRFCTTCGTPLQGGACPYHAYNGADDPKIHIPTPSADRRTSPGGLGRRLLALALAGWGLTLAGLVWQGALILGLKGDLTQARVQTNDAVASMSRLETRVKGLEAHSAGVANTAEVAKDSLESVFTIEVTGPLGGGLGTGFVVENGEGSSTLLTNFHVIETVWVDDRRDVKVRQGDLTYEGTIVRVSQAEDLAAIRIPVEITPLELRRRLPAVGEPVVVIGSPYGLEGTLGAGIVSAHRDGWIQFSAPVSPGDSGGPLLDAEGRVVGVTVSKVVSASAEGLSFAIPTRTACQTVLSCA